MITYNGKVVTSPAGKWTSPPRHYNLPPYTLRLRYTDGTILPGSSIRDYGTVTQVSSEPNIWEWTYEDSDWGCETGLSVRIIKVPQKAYLLEVMDAGDVSGVTRTANMFGDLAAGICPMLTSVCPMYLMNVTDCNGMFMNCNSLTNVGKLDIGNCIDARNMFLGCSSLKKVSFYSTPRLVQTAAMFYQCAALEETPALSMANVTNTLNMFGSCASIKHCYPYDFSSLENMRAMFANCTALEDIPLFNLPVLTDISAVCYHCTSLKYIPALQTPLVQSTYDAFNGCANVEYGALDFYNQAVDTTITKDGTFTNCGSNTTTGAAELAQIPSSWGGTGT